MTTTEEVTKRVVRIMQEIIASNIEPDINTQNDFATEINVAGTITSRWVNNQGCPTVDDLVNICRRFSVSADYLLLGRGDKYTGKVDKKDRLSRMEDELHLMKQNIDLLAAAARNNIMREQLKTPVKKTRNKAA